MKNPQSRGAKDMVETYNSPSSQRGKSRQRVSLENKGIQKYTCILRNLERSAHAQEMTYPLKRPEKTLNFHLWLIYSFSSSRKRRLSKQSSQQCAYMIKGCPNTQPFCKDKKTCFCFVCFLIAPGIQGNLCKNISNTSLKKRLQWPYMIRNIFFLLKTVWNSF